MDSDQNLAFSAVIKGQHKILEALEAQARQIGAIEGKLKEILVELSMLAMDREDREDRDPKN